MRPGTRRALRRLAIACLALLALLGLLWAALPRAAGLLGERALRRAGFPEARVLCVGWRGAALHVDRVDLAPGAEAALALGDVTLRLTPASVLAAEASAIHVGSATAELRRVDGAWVLPGWRAAEGRAPSPPAGARDPVGPSALPFERLAVDRVRLALASPAGPVQVSLLEATARRSHGALSAAASAALWTPAGELSGSLGLQWGAGGASPATLELEWTVEEGSAAAVPLDAQAIEGTVRASLAPGASPVAHLALRAERVRLAETPVGGLAVEGGWESGRVHLRVEDAPSGATGSGPAAEPDPLDPERGPGLDLHLELEAEPDDRRFEASARVRVADLARARGGGLRGTARLDGSVEGSWDGPAAGAPPRASGSFSLGAEGLAVAGRWRDGEASASGSFEARPGRVEVTAEEPWTARGTPAPEALPQAVRALAGVPLSLRFEPAAPVVATLDGAPGLQLAGALGLRSEGGAEASLQVEDAFAAWRNGATSVRVGSLRLSARNLPVAGLRLGVDGYRGALHGGEGRGALTGRGDLLLSGDAGGVAVEGGRLAWSGTLAADGEVLEARPDACLALSAAALRRDGLRLEGLSPPCVQGPDDAPLARYGLGDGELELDVSAASGPLALRLLRDGSPLESLRGAWPSLRSRLRWQQGALRSAELSLRGGRATLTRSHVRVADLEASLALEDGRISRARAALARVESTGDPALWVPLELEAAASREHAGAALALRATLSDRLGSFVLEADGAHRAGGGEVDLTLHPMSFLPGATGVADLSPWLATLAGEATGVVSFRGRMGWGAGSADASGTLRVEDLGLALQGASLSGLQMRVHLSSLWPPRTATVQEARVALLDVGVPLTQGRARFELVPGPALAVRELAFRAAGGRLLAEPFEVDLADPSSLRVGLRAEALELSQVFAISGIDGLQGEGRLSGRVPLALSADGVRMEGGSLDAGRDGVLRYTPEDPPAFLQGEGIRSRMLREVLRDYRYDELSLSLSGSVGEEQVVGLRARGHNPNFLDGHPVELTVDLEGPLVSVLRSALEPYRARGSLERLFQERSGRSDGSEEAGTGTGTGTGNEGR